MQAKAREIANRLRRASEVHVYCHIDSDGITGGSIATEALDRAGIPNKVTFLKKLDAATVEEIKNQNPPLAWFCDLGAGALHLLGDLDAVITDHHVPTDPAVPRNVRRDLLSFTEASDRILMLNPHDLGRGSDDISGSGTTYLVAKALDERNKDLAAIAVVGAVADMQEQEYRQLSGFNREILADGIAAGVLEASVDLRLFGRETRALHKLLQYASDPLLPRLTNNEEACLAFLLELGLDLKTEDGWVTWADLAVSERRLVLSELVRHMLQHGATPAEIERLVGEVYTLPREPRGSELRDAKEFGTLINACGRYEQAEVAYRVCRGDRDEQLTLALELLRAHRGNLVQSLDFIHGIGVTKLTAVQYFHGQDRIKDTVVGITAGMILNSGTVSRDFPIFGFAVAEDGVKVSGRGTRELVKRGLDLAAVMREASKALGGEGGGHHGAAGATIPPGSEMEFLAIADRIVQEQFTGPAP